ncbi:hypothetical protein DPMN_033884 [Dreissena polymorpha]|uniref:ubiquitinyl hydrolase 1 n=2 Tax=Dreissena polymorpha TaxID=45954 RepID=A0A9D4M6L6_DREPO|nr:hypothetical protein DPMN_033884 [Dreissena polymorpha]
MYNLAVKIHHKLDQTKLYSFPTIGAVCSYDEKQDCLIPDKARSKPKQCTFCSGTTLRQVRADGSNVYENGDRTTTPCVGGKCLCGFKHYWDGKEYDNLPEIYPVSLSWGGKTVSEEIPWFQDESNIALNSNVYEVAQNIVQKHFPGVFGSERLVQHVVDTILAQSAASYKEKNATESATLPETGEQEDGFDAEMASKIILTGPAKKTLHKEELVKSEKEKLVRQNIQAHAPKLQVKRASQNPSHKLVKTLHVAAPRGIPVLGTIVRDKLETETEAGSQSAFQSTSDQSVHKEKKVRLQTSDGRQVMLTLVEEVTYSALQRLIYEAVNVPEDRQRLRMGFPPKLLEAPPAGKEQVLDIKHGDKIALEILPDHTTSREDIELDVEATTVGAQGSSEEAHSSMSWTSFEKDIQNQNAETLLQALKNANQGGDSLDTSIASLTILSAVEGKDFWSYVQGMPHLFSVGGLLYQQVKRDMGLVDGKHCQLPCLPGKVFRYSATEDRLELCLEPDGHFQVQPNIEARVKERSVTDPRTEVKFGGSGAIHHGSDRPAFGGQGHSLKSTLTTEARMPGDLQYIPHHPHARGIKDLCSPPGSHQNTIDEETEEGMQTEQSAEVGKEEVLYHRLGPGYSVIDHSEMNDANRNLEMFRALSEHIERTLTQVTEEMEEDEESDQNVNASKGDPTLNDECSKTEAVVTECVDVIEVANALDVAKKEISNSNMDDRLFICSKLCPENHTESEKDEDVSKMQVDVAKTEEEISITEGTNMHLIEENRITSFEDRMDANNENLPTTEVFSCLEKPTDQREATFESKAGHEPENLNKDLVNETLESSTENK